MDDVFDTFAESAEVDTLHETVQDFTELSEQLAQDKTLTPELALESIPVLGHNGLFNTYYSVGNKQKRYAIATESLAKRVLELLRQAYELIKRILKKCLDWVKRKFGGQKSTKETKQAIHQAQGDVRLVISATQAAQELREPKTFREVVLAHKLDTEFIRAMSPVEYDIFIDGPYMKAIIELAKELEHGDALTEVSTQLTALEEWFAKVVSEAHAKDQAGTPLTEANTGMYYDEKSKDIVTANREGTDALLKALWASRDAKEALPSPTMVEKVYDMSGMGAELERVISRISMNDVGPVMDRWKNVLVALEAQCETASQNAIKLSTAAEHDDESRNRDALSAQYLNALGTFGSRITALQSALMAVEDYMYSESFTLYYRILTFLNKAAAAYQHESPSEETYHLFQMTREILAKKHE